MTPSKKRKSRRAGRSVHNESQRANAAYDGLAPKSEERVSPWSNWTICWLFLLTAVIVMVVFFPWLGRYIQGQFLGLTGDYGTDFFRYSQGSVGLLRQGIDPYSDEQMFRALDEGRLGTDHPNPFYDEQMASKGFAESPEPIAKGVVSPPFLLVFIYPLIHLCGYTLALNAWTVASFLGISWLSCRFWHRLIPPAPRWKQIGSHAAMLSLLVFASFPVLWSAIYGQFEVIYFLAIGGAIYLWSFKRTAPTTPLLVGLLLAIGGAVKVFPLLMLAYFFWQAVRFYKNSPKRSWAVRSLLRLPESKVLFFGVAFFVAINLLTGIVCGFDVYVSFFSKLADLQVEGTGPSMKGNLLSYLNFVPVWLFGPFTRMSGDMWPLYAVAAVGVCVAMARSIRGKVGSAVLTRRDQLTCLLEMTLILAALPTILPHWWIYYNVILILPLMVCFIAAKETTDNRARRWIMTLTALSFVLTFSYLTTAVFFGAFPEVYDVLMNRTAVDAALAKASAEPALLENLPYSKAFGHPYVAEFEGRVISPFNLLFGYPGTVFLMIANWLALRAQRRETSPQAGRRVDGVTSAVDSLARTPRRKVLLTLAGGVLLSLAGGYGIVWEGRRRLALVPKVEFVADEHSIEDPRQYLDQLLERLRQTAPREESSEWGGLVSDLLPPNHFIQVVAQTDRMLAAAILRQDRRYFQDPGVVEKLLALFEQYQANLSAQYLSRFEKGQESDVLAWRYQGHPGGLLVALERECREQAVPLRRMDQEWMQWQLRFLCEYTWQRALESLSRNDFPQFVKFILEHQTALSRHQVMVENRIAQLRVSLFQQPSESAGWRAGFVYIQQPSFTALSSYPACSELDEEMLVETGVRVGTLYVVEELLRRARLAKSGDPWEALSFARMTVSRIGSRQVNAWWSEPAAVGPQEILQSLSRDGLLDVNQVESEGLLIWDQPLDQAAASLLSR